MSCLERTASPLRHALPGLPAFFWGSVSKVGMDCDGCHTGPRLCRLPGNRSGCQNTTRMISGGKWAPLKLIAIVALPLIVLDHLNRRAYPKCIPNENLRQNLMPPGARR